MIIHQTGVTIRNRNEKNGKTIWIKKQIVGFLSSDEITESKTYLIERKHFIIQEKSNRLDEKPSLKQNQFPELKE